MARRKRKRKGEPEGFGGDDAGPPGDTKLTPVDVQQKVFRLAFRGYREGDVDEFLDQVTETLALLHEENKRLRESLDSGTGGAPGSVSAAERQAAEIVRQAREHAARLVEDAERKVPPGEGRPAVPVSGSFLVRERAFLQRLASLVQSHARSLKDEARRAREASSSAEPVPAEAEGGRPQGREVGEDTGPEVVAPAADDVTAMPAEAPPSGEGPRADRPEEEREDQPPNREPSASLGGQPPGAPAAPTAAPSVAEAAPPPAAEPASPGPAAEPAVPPPAAEPATRAFSAGAPSQEDAPTVPWRPAESESPTEAGWSVEGSGEEGDPLLSAWESAFLARPEEDQPADGEPSPAEEPRGEEKEHDSQEPSLRELFWGEE